MKCSVKLKWKIPFLKSFVSKAIGLLWLFSTWYLSVILWCVLTSTSFFTLCWFVWLDTTTYWSSLPLQGITYVHIYILELLHNLVLNHKSNFIFPNVSLFKRPSVYLRSLFSLFSFKNRQKFHDQVLSILVLPWQNQKSLFYSTHTKVKNCFTKQKIDLVIWNFFIKFYSACRLFLKALFCM